MEIVPNVHRVEGVRGSNAVLIADEQMAIVDTGIAGNADTIVKYIKSIGRSPSDLRWIVLSHFHFDHSGSAAELADMTGARIVTHKDEAETQPDGRVLLRKGNEGEPPPTWYRIARRMPVRRDTRVYPDIVVDERMDDGDMLPVLGGLHIIHTPGHTAGSICPILEGPDRVLFLGDSVLNNVTRLSRPLMWDRKNRRTLDESLRRLRELDADAASFGHGPPLTADVMMKIRGLTDRPYDLPTWRIALKNWRTLKRFADSSRGDGNWSGGAPE
jgi:glyoxylase-like metal-dependent hydrolase (beta-lactamase superfamily II)